MSTLPFLLSVADELDNLNSQSYMDDFGLGFHPHRQFYRTPTIQLSLPAGTDWMQQDNANTGRHHGSTSSRYRSYRCYTDNNLQTTTEDDEEADAKNGENGGSSSIERYEGASCSTSATASAKRAQKFVSALNSNNDDENGGENEDDSIDNSEKLCNLSKKCGKNYYRQRKSNTSTNTTTTTNTASRAGSGAAINERSTKTKSSNMGYRLHSNCLEGNNSSSEESLQKVTSSIEFLTCFLLKKSRATKGSPMPSPSTPSSSQAADNKKS